MEDITFELDVNKITLDDMEELEKATSYPQIKAWLARHCNVTVQQVGKMTLAQLGQIKADIKATVMGDSIPKASARI